MPLRCLWRDSVILISTLLLTYLLTPLLQYITANQDNGTDIRTYCSENIITSSTRHSLWKRKIISYSLHSNLRLYTGQFQINYDAARYTETCSSCIWMWLNREGNVTFCVIRPLSHCRINMQHVDEWKASAVKKIYNHEYIIIFISHNYLRAIRGLS